MKKQHQLRTGFTIVELLIVIVVIAILAVIVTVAYNGIQRRAAASMLEDTLSSVAQAMEVAAVESSSYETLPVNVKIPSGVGVALMRPVEPATTMSTFCINAKMSRYSNMTYSIAKDGAPKDSACESEEIIAVLGDYESGPAVDRMFTAPSKGVAAASGVMNVRAETDDTWSRVTVSWDAIAGVTKYMLNAKASTDTSWYGVTETCGYTSWDAPMYSPSLAPSVTSFTMAVGDRCLGKNFDESHSYRIRYLKDGVWSDWTELSMSPLTSPQRTVPKLANFKIEPSTTWSSARFSWDSLGTFAKLPGVKVRLNFRTSPTASWLGFTSTCGTTSWNASMYSPAVSPTATHFDTTTWAGCFPSDAATTFEYRAQIYSGTVAGEWSYISFRPLDRYSEGALPAIRNFTVTPTEKWDGTTFSWDAVDPRFTNIPGLKVRLNFRTSESGSWQAMSPSCGITSWNAAAYSAAITPTATSYTTAGTGCLPQSAAITYQYRVQLYSGAAESEWVQVSLNPLHYLDESSLPRVNNLAATSVSGGSGVNITWDAVNSRFINIPSLKVRLNVRFSPTAQWQAMSPSCGITSWNAAAYSAAITPTATSYAVNGASCFPAVGSTYEYRIQVYSAAIEGPWTAITVAR